MGPLLWVLLLCATRIVSGDEDGASSGGSNTDSGESGSHRTSVFTMGKGVYASGLEVNVIFLIVVLVTVLLELGMHFLIHHARSHSKQLLMHLNKELALLGIVAFLLMTVASASSATDFLEQLDLFDWCHIQLFFVALLTIASHAVLNLILKLQEHYFGKFEHTNSVLATGFLSGWGTRRQLHFELARYVFECDRRKFFSKQLLTATRRKASQVSISGPSQERSASSLVAGEREGSAAGEAERASSGTQRCGSRGAGTGGSHVDADRQPSAMQAPSDSKTCDTEAVDVRIAIAADHEAEGQQPTASSSPMELGASGNDAERDDFVEYLASQLQALRVTPLIVNKLRAAVQDRPATPDEFSFAEYRIRCARKGLVKLLHVGWLAWAVLLLVLCLQQIPLQMLTSMGDYVSVHITVTGCLLFLLFSAMWLWMRHLHRNCIRRLAEAALLHYASEGSLADDDWSLRLEPLLSGTYPRLAKRVRKRVLLPEYSIHERLVERQKGLYQRSLLRQKKSFWAHFQYPRNVTLVLQVLMMWNGLFFSLFLLTCFDMVEWAPRDIFNWVLGLGTPLATHAFFLPSIMFSHTFIVSAGDMVDLKVMRQIEQEHREKLLRHTQRVERRRLMGRILAKLKILASLEVDTWEDAIACLEAIGSAAPSSLSPSASCRPESRALP